MTAPLDISELDRQLAALDQAVEEAEKVAEAASDSIRCVGGQYTGLAVADRAVERVKILRARREALRQRAHDKLAGIRDDQQPAYPKPTVRKPMRVTAKAGPEGRKVVSLPEKLSHDQIAELDRLYAKHRDADALEKNGGFSSQYYDSH